MEDQGFQQASSRGKPNILFIMLDDAGQGDWLDPSIAPNLAKFKEKATLYPQFYTSPMCGPTRISMLSGRSHADYSMLWVCGSNALYGIPNSDSTIPQSLEGFGYKTATLGKWHASGGATTERIRQFPTAKEYLPGEKFEYYLESQGVVGKGYWHPTVDDNGRKKSFKGHQSDIISNQVISKLKDYRSSQNKPFYLQYWLNAPHSPHHPHPRMFKNKKRQEEYLKHNSNRFSKDPVLRREAKRYFKENKSMLYSKLLQQADENIGKVLNFIATSKDPYIRNTVILITSDNGGTKDTRPTNEPYGNKDYRGRDLRGFKSQVFEGGIRQNLLVKMPGQNSGHTNNSVISVMDLFPTYIDLIGESVPSSVSKHFDGESFYSIMKSPREQFNRRKTLYWPFKTQNEHVSTTEGNDLMSWAIRKGRWKLIREPQDNCTPCLFDFVSGFNSERPQDDVKKKHPDLVKRLREDYLEWYLSTSQLALEPVESTGVRIRDSKIPGFKKRGAQETVYDFDFTGKQKNPNVRLKNNIKFEVNRLDFTFSAKITIDKILPVSQVIAMRKGTWRFEVNPQGQLQVVTKSKDGRQKTVRTNIKIRAGLSYDVAFSIYSFKSLDSVVRIFCRDHGDDIDNEERLFQVARAETWPGLKTNDNTIYLGADPSSNHWSLKGLIEQPRLYHVPLRRSEIGYGMRWWGNRFD